MLHIAKTALHFLQLAVYHNPFRVRCKFSMAKSAISRPMPVTVMTFLVAALLLMSSEVANATLNHDVASGLQLGRRALLAETAGRGGYNAHPDGRGGYNAHPDGRGGYN
ncbi:hypothetical protein DKX38_008196 [Salix brachista]|uniref:Glycine-rich protein n=3 Tax=Salix TaxID=40685 RepID=A0A5N5MQI1_9ROSI|nr:hypothetical protein DKX38_008196 [Salix brachista]